MKQTVMHSDLSTNQWTKLFPFYFHGSTGRRIYKHGGNDAQLLGLYSIGNLCATSIGLYHFPLSVIRGALGMDVARVAPAFEALERAEFAAYDYGTEHIWVKEMARVRFGLTDRSDCLKKSDSRIILANRLYKSLPEIPFLWGFYLRYRSSLRLVTPRHPKVSRRNHLGFAYGPPSGPPSDASRVEDLSSTYN